MSNLSKTRPQLGRAFRKGLALAGLAAVIGATFSAPALADRDWRWHHRHWHHRYVPCCAYSQPPVIYNPPGYYYAPPPPVVYGPRPGLNVTIPLRIR